jgi:hypothetical protein
MVREQIFAWNGTIPGVPQHPSGKSLNDWWDETISHLPKAKKREASGAIIYSMWGVWKERNVKSLNDWWDETISHLPKAKKREASGAIIYSMWGV